MTPEQAVAFYVFAIVAAVTPGPSNVMLTATGANVGVLRGLPCFFGVVLGMGLMMFLVALGLGHLVLGNPMVMTGLKWGGVGVLLWLSWRIATAGRSEAADPAKPIGFLGAAAFQWVNPKAWLVCASAVGAYFQADAGSAFLQSVFFGGLFVLATMPSGFVWLGFGAALQRILRTERALRIFNIAMGATLAASIVLFIW